MLNIKVVGGGCSNCRRLEGLCREVVEEAQIEAEIEKITDYDKFVDLGIFMTPGLLLNDKVVSSGKIPRKSILSQWIQNAVK